MENCESSVRVAVNIRPLVPAEVLEGCTDCIAVCQSQKQVQIGSHSFTFDYVFGSRGSPSSTIFDECVAPLCDALFHGYNGTVLAYGQTGSGKTYMMGTNFNSIEHGDAIIPKVMDTIFSKVETMKESTEFFIRVSFIEVLKDDVFDLLDPKTTGPARVPIQIRERVSGGILLAGVTESEVTTKEEMASYLHQGSLSRATECTKMNSQSSRSHAIFTISMEQRRKANSSAGDDVIAKLHLVDLAGSERVKRTGADGSRLQEGIHINKGLLALGNVISALGDDKKRKEGGHVPYRNSKLTRILQDSLGGNCKTIMIACVSPADTNVAETLSTLQYANRARNIQNNAIINRDPVTAEMQRMRSQIEQLQSELLYFRGDSSVPTEEIPALEQTIEHELEESVRVHQVWSEYEQQKKERAKMAEELARLEEEALNEKEQNLSEFSQTMSPGARNSRISTLEIMIATCSSTLDSMASQLSEAKVRERAFSGRGWWNQIHSVAEAKNGLQILFNLASSSRCQLRDKEVENRDLKEENRDLKEKIVHLLALQRQSHESRGSGNMTSSSGRHVYDLRPKGFRNSEPLENMDISDDQNEEDCLWGRTRERKRRQVRKRSYKMDAHEEKTPVEGVCCSCGRNSSCQTSRCECRVAKGVCSSSCPCSSSRRQLSSKSDIHVEKIIDLGQSTLTRYLEGVFCSCSKDSLCRTSRCQCRVANGVCNSSCSCRPCKCCNRERPVTVSEEAKTSHDLVAHGVATSN